MCRPTGLWFWNTFIYCETRSVMLCLNLSSIPGHLGKPENSGTLGWVGKNVYFSLTYRNFKISCQLLKKNVHVYLRLLFTKKTNPPENGGGGGPRGVLRYISDGDVRSPFWGLKFAIWGLFWVRDFGKDIFGRWQKAKLRVLIFKSNNYIGFIY